MPFRPLAALTSLVLLLALLTLPAPLGAQTATEGGEATVQQGGEQGSRYGALLRLLEDEALRERLVEDLGRLQEGEPPAEAGGERGTGAGAPPPVAEEQISLSRRIARTTRGGAEWAAGRIHGLVADIEQLEFEEAGEERWLQRVGFAALELGAVILFTLATFLVLRRGARGLYAGLGRRAESLPNLPLRAAAVALGSLIDALAVILAWIGGYLLALFAIGAPGDMNDRHALFLNAFLLIELVKVALRLALSPGFAALRPLPIGNEDAAYWYAWLGRIVSVLGYGLLLVVPMVRFNLSVGIGQALAVLIGAAALLMAVVLVLQNRRPIRDWLERRAQENDVAFTRSLLMVLARGWHLIAVAYLSMLFLVSLLHPEDALPFMLAATGESIAAVLLGMLVTLGLTRAIAVGVRLPEETRRNLPMLEQRLNAYVPNVLRAMRLIVFVSVLLYLMHAWGLFDLVHWLSEGGGSDLLSLLVTLGLLALASLLLWLAVASWVEHRLNPEVGLPDQQPSARTRTLLAIFRNAFAIVLTIMTVMIALSEIGIDIGPLLAGAGVLGLAIGFGAQRMVQDVITGVFIQLENALNVGDVVTVAGITGTVEKLTIRSVGVRDLHGTYHLVSFSQVGHVSNFMRDFGYHVGEYGIAYRENVDDAVARLQEAFEELRGNADIAPSLIGDLEVFGVTALGDSAVNIRVRIKTLPGMQWGVGRAYNKLVKKHFDAGGIEIPYPHMTLYFGEDKDGSAPPLRLMQLRAEAATAAGDAQTPSLQAPAPEPVKEVLPGEEYDNAVTDEERDEQPPAPGKRPD